MNPVTANAKTLKSRAAKARTAWRLNNQYHFFNAGNNKQ
jgi:hypothetical protein